MSSPTPPVVVVPDVVLAAYDRVGAVAAPFGSGLINHTFLVEQEGKPALILQRQHRVFGPKVNDDIAAVTAHLQKKGLTTAKIVRTIDDRSCVVIGDLEDLDGREIWRAQTVIEGGASVDKLSTPAQARAAGMLVAGFHAAVEDLSHAYLHVRDGVHDTKKHLLALARSLAKHRNHRLGKQAGALGKEILDAGARLPDLTTLPLRHSHGDLKINNLLFTAPIDVDAPVGLALVDLDTLQKLQWPLEMGDALRSWTNPKGEDVDTAKIDVELFRAAVEGYFAAPKKPFLLPEETEALVDGLFTICVELAARFCADALEEKYFGFDSKKYKTRGDHNLVRARGQWALARSVRDKRDELNAIVKAAAR
ncbi:MAG TPA: phosphotransferase [Myxococcota bacterium]